MNKHLEDAIIETPLVVKLAAAVVYESVKSKVTNFAKEHALALGPKADSVIGILAANQIKVGKAYCPCQATVNECPCANGILELMEKGMCHCGLFVKAAMDEGK